MIGGPSGPVPKTSIIASGTTVQSNYFGYANGFGYSPVDTLQPGYAYWVKVSQNGILILNGATQIQKSIATGGSLRDLDHLTFEDVRGMKQTLYIGTGSPKNPSLYLMPPRPPEGIFDARFASGQIAEFTDGNYAKDLMVLLSSAQFPVTISSSLRTVDVSFVQNGKNVSLRGDQTVKLTAPIGQLLLHAGSSPERPSQYALDQNYPNPFNPSTRLQYALPVDSKVRLVIYNVLGQVAAELVNGVEAAGYKSSQWNASSFSSGVYFYRLEATSTSDVSKSFTQVRKMLLIK